METNPQTYERIERYLLDKMDDAEKQSFEEDLKNDAEMRQELDNMEQIFRGIEIASLKSVLEEIHEEQQEGSGTSSTSSSTRWIFGIAAGIAVLIAGVWFFMSQDASPEALYADYYIQDHGLPSRMGVANNVEFEEAMVSYKRGNYMEALPVFESLLRDEPENDTLHYYIASTYMAQGDIDSALEGFDKVDEVDWLKERSQWYIALAYLKKGDVDEARNMLDTIAADQNHPYSSKAKELLPQISR